MADVAIDALGGAVKNAALNSVRVELGHRNSTRSEGDPYTAQTRRRVEEFYCNDMRNFEDGATPA